MIPIGRFVDYYEILHVKPDAPHEDILAAYAKEMARFAVLHLPPDEKEKRGALLNRAALILGDEQKRIAYDVYGEGGITAAEPADQAMTSHYVAAGGAMPRNIQYTVSSEDNQGRRVLWGWLFRKHPVLSRKCMIACGVMLFTQFLLSNWHLLKFDFWLSALKITCEVSWLLVLIGQILFIRFGLLGRPLFRLQFRSPRRLFMTILYASLSLFLSAVVVTTSSFVVPSGSRFSSLLMEIVIEGVIKVSAAEIRGMLFSWENIASTFLYLYLYFTILCYQDQSAATDDDGISHDVRSTASSESGHRERVLRGWLFQRHSAFFKKCTTV